MTNKHTPAPWSWKLSSDYEINILGGDSLIACVFVDDNIDNAKLIAASPDLLEICLELQECAFYWSDYDVPLGIVERLNAAIAKATGVNHDADE